MGVNFTPTAELKGEKRYSLRIGKGFRDIAFRDGLWTAGLGLYPDHDSAYGKL